MKNNIWKVFVVCSLAGIVICMIQIRGLNQEIHNLNNQMKKRLFMIKTTKKYTEDFGKMQRLYGWN